MIGLLFPVIWHLFRDHEVWVLVVDPDGLVAEIHFFDDERLLHFHVFQVYEAFHAATSKPLLLICATSFCFHAFLKEIFFLLSPLFEHSNDALFYTPSIEPFVLIFI